LALEPNLTVSLRREFISDDIESILVRVKGTDPLAAIDRQRLQRWLEPIAAKVGISSSAVVAAEDIDQDSLIQCINQEVERRRADREQVVRRRLARHLSEMSEERFFKEDSNFAEVKEQLRRHAIQLLGRWLIDEEDVEVRESMARTLGNVGEPEAVNALARAVAGEERTRASRKNLLEQYYLQPSKAQSDQASKILKESVEEAKKTLRILQVLNFVFAGVGLTFLTVGLAMLFYSNDPQLQFAGGAISVTAFFGLVLQVIREPLDRIQLAMNRLVQVEAAFTSFIWELNLNGTYIQSQYVARGVLESQEIADTVDRIESAMRLSMDLVATYADDSRKRVAPTITSILPGAISGGRMVHIKGEWLSGGRSTRGGRGAGVHLNHVPIQVETVTWSDREVQIRLPDDVARLAGVTDGAAGTAWLSLAVDGQETNAVPLQLRPGAT
jgi:hypothetical protein